MTILFKIIVPISKPVIITSGLVIFINNWGAYHWPLIVGHSPDIKLVQVALTDFKLEHTTAWGQTFAASVIITILPVAIFVPFQKYYVQGIATSGIKG